MTRRTLRATTMIEVLVSTIVVGLIMGGLLAVVSSIYSAETFAVTMPSVQSDARQMALTVAAGIRNATICTSSDQATGPCIWPGGAIESPTGAQLTVYHRQTDGTLANVKYYISSDGTNTFCTDTKTGHSGSSTTVTQRSYTDAGISFTYYQSTSSAYHTNGLSQFASFPTSATSGQLIAIGITARITRGSNVNGQYTTLVRLRNSPQQTYPQ
ncbi:MAG TPA: hypothetical protein VG944_05100 [Fimbriimonas sp.]|nr:hypothetical protein [Fimbriimonas sp.]